MEREPAGGTSMTRRIGAALVAMVLAAAGSLPGASAQDPGGKKGAPPADSPQESKDQIDRAKALEKKLDAKNKLEVNAALEALGGLATPTAARVLMDFAHKTPNSEYGALAVRSLGWAGNKGALDFLSGTDGARSGRLLVAEAACQSLAKIGEKSSVPTLLEVIKTGKSVVVCAAIQAVVLLDRAAEGLANLLAGMTGNSDDQIRMSVAEALGNLDSPKAADALVFMAGRDSNSLVRLNAVRGLGKLHPPKGRKVLEDLAARDKNQEVRQAAEAALSGYPGADPATPPK